MSQPSLNQAGASASEFASPEARQAFFVRLREELATPIQSVIVINQKLVGQAEISFKESLRDLERIRKACHRLSDLIVEFSDPDCLLTIRQMRHDLCTPLSHIIGFSEMLQDIAHDESIGGMLGDLKRTEKLGRDMLSFINELFSRPSQPESVIMSTQNLELSSPIAEPPQSQPSGYEGRLLVVDDNEQNREILAALLAQLGYDITLASNGIEAIHLAEFKSFDLMLLDIMMPLMNGYQVLAYLKAEPGLQSLPVIMVTALDEIESVVRCIESGAEDYISKPFDPILLRTRIEASLEKKRLRARQAELLKQVQSLQAELAFAKSTLKV